MRGIKAAIYIDMTGQPTVTFEEAKEWVESTLEEYECPGDNPLSHYDVTDFPVRVLDVQPTG